jgi:hypothetical protein
MKAILREKKYGSALFKGSAATAQNILQHLGISETPDSRMLFTFHVLAINAILFDIVGLGSPGLTSEFHAQLNDWLNASHHDVITLHKLWTSKSDHSRVIEYLPLEFKSQYRDTDDKDDHEREASRPDAICCFLRRNPPTGPSKRPKKQPRYASKLRLAYAKCIRQLRNIAASVG